MNNRQQQHPHPGVEPLYSRPIAVILPDDGEVKHITYEYYPAPAGQPAQTVYLSTGIVQTGGVLSLPPDYPS
ncbi:unnamed protein product, partial [Rotaria sp. Silwood2]